LVKNLEGGGVKGKSWGGVKKNCSRFVKISMVDQTIFKNAIFLFFWPKKYRGGGGSRLRIFSGGGQGYVPPPPPIPPWNNV